MEPLWLGITGSSLGSAVRSVASKAVEPFELLLETAQKLAGKESVSEDSAPRLSLEKNPHFQLLAQALGDQSGTAGATELELSDIRDRADSLQQDLEERIAQTLQEAGIEFYGEFQISFSEIDGTILLSGDTDQRGEVEQTLANDPAIAADLRQLSALKSLLSAADRSSAFADAYELDPFQAVEDFSNLFESAQKASLSGSSLLVQLRFE